MSDEINAVIADDHPIFRRGLRQSLEENQGTESHWRSRRREGCFGDDQ